MTDKIQSRIKDLKSKIEGGLYRPIQCKPPYRRIGRRLKPPNENIRKCLIPCEQLKEPARSKRPDCYTQAVDKLRKLRSQID